jgi:hypothetical protein
MHVVRYAMPFIRRAMHGNGMAMEYGTGMAMAWQWHGNGVAMAWQWYGNGVAMAWQ